MRTATKLTGAAVIAITALALSACSTAAPTPTKTAAAAGSVDLRMTTWTADPTQLALFNSIADNYKKTHPEIGTITFDSLPFADYTSTITTQIAGGQQPDLAWVMETDAPDFVSSGALAPLTDALKATKGYDYSDINSGTTKLWTTGGQLYAYPFSTSPFVVFANDDLLAAAGEPTSAELKAQGKWDWKDIAEIGAQVNAKTGKQGMSSATSTTRPGRTLPRSGIRSAHPRGRRTARPASSPPSRWWPRSPTCTTPPSSSTRSPDRASTRTSSRVTAPSR